jgi:hypothetical protein
MKIRNTILSLMAISMIIGISACTDSYESYNTNPYDSTKDEMQRDGYLLSSALTGMEAWVIPLDVNTNQFVECLLGGNFGGYLSDSNSGFNGKNFATYNPEEHWLRVPFNDVIPNIFIRHAQVIDATEDVIPLAVSDIIKVAAMSRVTDIYGPIPYSKIGVDGKITAPYDSQQDIYNEMFKELNSAIGVLTKNRTNDFNAKCDRVYSGNVEHWIKFANSLKLRMAIRIANVDAATAQKEAEEAANNEIGTMTSNEDNAFMTVSNTNPFEVIMYEYNNGDSRIGADITSFMNGYNDPRRPFFFTTSTFDDTEANGYVGLRSGIQIPGGNVIKQYSNMIVKSNSKVMWMNAAETAFLKAEGALRGWNMGTPSVTADANAEGFYKMGIQLSFDQWGASNAEAYMNDNTSTPQLYQDPANSSFSYGGSPSTITIKWNSSANFETNLERIITQKWIANFPLGLEAWAEYRRTGYPNLMKVQVNISGGKVSTGRMARRLAYPQLEREDNTINYNDAVTNLLKGPDTMGTDVWWAKKN